MTYFWATSPPTPQTLVPVFSSRHSPPKFSAAAHPVSLGLRAASSRTPYRVAPRGRIGGGGNLALALVTPCRCSVGVWNDMAGRRVLSHNRSNGPHERAGLFGNLELRDSDGRVGLTGQVVG